MKSKTAYFKISAILAFMFFQFNAFATWSIILLDPATKTIGVAGASCTGSVFGVAKVITGVGAMTAQAYQDEEIVGKGLNLMRKGATPNEILQLLKDPSIDKQLYLRQYGIATFKDYNSPVTFTGDSILYFPYAAAISSPGICVQGNTLADSSLVREVYKAVKEARNKGLSMEESLILALEVGSKLGGDRRCGSQTAQSAFIQIVKPDDHYYSYLSLSIACLNKGGKNPIKVLRTEYDKIKDHLSDNMNTEIIIVPKE